MSQCPGQRPRRDVESVEIECPTCGRTVEMFTDEIKHRCKCGKWLLREKRPSCADWCLMAEKCLGPGVDVQGLRKRLAEVRNDPKAKECVERVKRLLADKQTTQR